MLWERSSGLPSFLEQLVVFLQSFVNNQLPEPALAHAASAGAGGRASAFGLGLSLALPPAPAPGLGARRNPTEEVAALAHAGLQFIANNLSISSIVTGGRAGVNGWWGGWGPGCGGPMRQARRPSAAAPLTPRCAPFPLPAPCPPASRPLPHRRPRGPAAPRGAADAQGGLGAGPDRVRAAAAGHAPAAPAARRAGGQPVRAGGGGLPAPGPAGARHLALLPGARARRAWRARRGTGRRTAAAAAHDGLISGPSLLRPPSRAPLLSHQPRLPTAPLLRPPEVLAPD